MNGAQCNLQNRLTCSCADYQEGRNLQLVAAPADSQLLRAPLTSSDPCTGPRQCINEHEEAASRQRQTVTPHILQRHCQVLHLMA